MLRPPPRKPSAARTRAATQPPTTQPPTTQPPTTQPPTTQPPTTQPPTNRLPAAQLRAAEVPSRSRTGSVSTAAVWALVVVLGVSFGAIGLGGVIDLVRGDERAEPAVASTVAPAEDQAGPGGQAPDDAPGSSAVVAPEQVPRGQALTGSAPSPRGVVKGSYAPFRPTGLRLPSGARAPVQRAGVHADGALNIPENPGRVGWWTGGAQADDPYGSMVLAGHVDSRVYGVGVMAEMLNMRIGQVVTVTGGRAGQLAQEYRVVARMKMTKAALTEGTDLFDQEVAHRLVMITCGGPFDRATHRYRDNVVVIAEPVS